MNARLNGTAERQKRQHFGVRVIRSKQIEGSVASARPTSLARSKKRLDCLGGRHQRSAQHGPTGRQRCLVYLRTEYIHPRCGPLVAVSGLTNGARFCFEAPLDLHEINFDVWHSLNTLHWWTWTRIRQLQDSIARPLPCGPQRLIELPRPQQDVLQTRPDRVGPECLLAHLLVRVEGVDNGVQEFVIEGGR